MSYFLIGFLLITSLFLLAVILPWFFKQFVRLYVSIGLTLGGTLAWIAYEACFSLAEIRNPIRVDLFVIIPTAGLAWLVMGIILVLTYFQLPKDT